MKKESRTIKVKLGRLAGGGKEKHVFPKGTSPRMASLLRRIIATFHQVMDPELDISIRDLGLVYEVHLAPDGHVSIYMTLTTPNCPGVDQILGDMEKEIQPLKGVTGLDIHLVFDPPYDAQKRMSDNAKTLLDFML